MRRAFGLGELPAAAHDDDDDAPPRQKILPEAAVERLNVVCANYTAPNPYKVGDFVTPRSDAPQKGAGDPHVVVEVLDTPFRTWGASEPADCGSPYFGQALNVRAACITPDGSACLFWMEHGALEPYVPQ